MLAIEGGHPVRSSFLPFAKPFIGQEEEEEVLAALRSGWLTTGPRSAQLERVIAQTVSAPHVLAVSSCTAALHLALVLAGVGPGDEVVTSPMTFATTANVILHQRAVPVFADVEPDSLNLDPDALARSITSKTKAVIPVHLAGLPCDLDRIAEVARSVGAVVIEDAAHAINAKYRGTPIGSISPFTAFSFYAIKNITAGEGGALTLLDEELARQGRIWATCGITSDAWHRYGPKGFKRWRIEYPGYKYNLSDVLAAIALRQFQKIENLQARRNALAARYRTLLSGIDGVVLPPERDYAEHAHHLFIIQMLPEQFARDRNYVLEAMQSENIGVGLHFEAVHLHPYYKDTLGYSPGICPVAEQASDQILSLPLYPAMTDGDADDVAEAVHKVFRAIRR